MMNLIFVDVLEDPIANLSGEAEEGRFVRVADCDGDLVGWSDRQVERTVRVGGDSGSVRVHSDFFRVDSGCACVLGG